MNASYDIHAQVKDKRKVRFTLIQECEGFVEGFVSFSLCSPAQRLLYRYQILCYDYALSSVYFNIIGEMIGVEYFKI